MADIMVKPASALADKFASRAQNATNEYSQGVQTTAKDQNALAQAAADRWATATAAAAANKLFAKGLSRSSTADWKAGVAAKGAARFGPGAAAAKGKWAARVQVFFDTLNSLALSAKLPKGDPSNMNRSAQVAAALHAKKISG
jgi:hypothetical protein